MVGLVITNRSILDVAAVLDPPLIMMYCSVSNVRVDSCVIRILPSICDEGLSQNYVTIFAKNLNQDPKYASRSSVDT